MDNAVRYYQHLREQGVLRSAAIEHVRLRFGIDADTLKRRLDGYVADPHATREALSSARRVITEGPAQPLGDGGTDELVDVLQALYEAVTGERL